MERDEKMNTANLSGNKSKFIIIVVLYLIIAFAFYWYLLKPQFAEITALNKEISKSQQKLALLRLAHNREKFLIEEDNLMSSRITKLQEILPVKRNDFIFGEEFLALGKLCGVTYTSLSFPSSRGKSQGKNNTVQFTLSFTSKKLDNVRYFLIHLYRFPQIVRVDSLSISKSNKQSGVIYGKSVGPVTSIYNVSITGEIYLSGRK